MASVATTSITNISRLVAGSKGTGFNIGGCPAAMFRIAAGQTAGDTAVLQDPNVPNILTVIGPGSNNIGTSPTGVTAVTVTLAAVSGTAPTVTAGVTDWIIIGPVVQS